MRMATNTVDSTREFLDRLMNDAQFRESVEAAPTLHDRGQVLLAAGYRDINMETFQEAVKQQAAALGAGVQVDPERVKRVEALFVKAATDPELQQALQAAATTEAKRDVLAQAGYGDITLDDLKAAAADLAQREELTDAELEQVSGGAVSEGSIWAFLAGVGGGAAIGFAVGGPPGAAVGGLLGLIPGVGGALACEFLKVPGPSDW